MLRSLERETEAIEERTRNAMRHVDRPGNVRDTHKRTKKGAGSGDDAGRLRNEMLVVRNADDEEGENRVSVAARPETPSASLERDKGRTGSERIHVPVLDGIPQPCRDGEVERPGLHIETSNNEYQWISILSTVGEAKFD